MATPLASATGFDRLSKVYDRLAGLVYGKALRRAQTHFLSRIQEGSNVLVVGGGTGWFLEALLRTEAVQQVTYIELSAGMLQKSQERIQANIPTAYAKVNWIHGTIQDVDASPQFDLVCTLCFLDLFAGDRLQAEVSQLHRRLKPDASWYFSDFRYADGWPMSWISRGMIWGMYRFFRWTCKIEAKRLGDFDGALEAIGFEAVERMETYGGMIEAVWYQPRK